MKNAIQLPLFFLILVLAACGGTKEQNASQDSTQAEAVHEKAGEEHSGEEEKAAEVALNEGQKWEANAETNEGIQKMQSMVKEYLDKSSTDHEALSENLEKEFNNVLQKCTMTGEAHNQLHNYLLPLKNKIADLKENSKPEVVKDVQSYLANYGNYFQ